jgi:hypothetical protein
VERVPQFAPETNMWRDESLKLHHFDPWIYVSLCFSLESGSTGVKQVSMIAWLTRSQLLPLLPMLRYAGAASCNITSSIPSIFRKRGINPYDEIQLLEANGGSDRESA